MHTLGLVAAGIVVGILLQVVLSLGSRQESRYPALQRVDEPQVGAVVADAIRRDDPAALINSLASAELLSKLHGSITPIVAVTEVKFVGATMSGGQVLAGYVVKGPTEAGVKVARGFVLHVAHGEVVFVN